MLARCTGWVACCESRLSWWRPRRNVARLRTSEHRRPVVYRSADSRSLTVGRNRGGPDKNSVTTEYRTVLLPLTAQTGRSKLLFVVDDKATLTGKVQGNSTTHFVRCSQHQIPSTNAGFAFNDAKAKGPPATDKAGQFVKRMNDGWLSAVWSVALPPTQFSLHRLGLLRTGEMAAGIFRKAGS